MLEIDGAAGGGQLLRSALTLSICSGQPFRMVNIRRRRAKAGLMRQHLTAVEAAAAISGAALEGAHAGSTELRFAPGTVRGGHYRFAIGTAGSTTLVLQTVLPALLRADTATTLELHGGTHNPMAPPAEFLMQTYAPLLRRMGAQLDITLERPGFYPVGGGVLRAAIAPGALHPQRLHDRGAPTSSLARALVSAIPGRVGERELEVVAHRIGLSGDQLEMRAIHPPVGPGNALLIALGFAELTAVFAGFGERGISAEAVAERACAQAEAYLQSGAFACTHLADQLLLPLALAGGGSFTAQEVSDHLDSHAALIEKFLPREVVRVQRGKHWEITVST